MPLPDPPSLVSFAGKPPTCSVGQPTGSFFNYLRESFFNDLRKSLAPGCHETIRATRDPQPICAPPIQATRFFEKQIALA
jgi:hypothetical protein